jgi:hypothetical protein
MGLTVIKFTMNYPPIKFNVDSTSLDFHNWRRGNNSSVYFDNQFCKSPYPSAGNPHPPKFVAPPNRHIVGIFEWVRRKYSENFQKCVRIGYIDIHKLACTNSHLYFYIKSWRKPRLSEEKGFKSTSPRRLL